MTKERDYTDSMPVNTAPRQQAPKPSPQRGGDMQSRATEQKTASSPPPKTKKKMGFAVALLLVFFSSTYDLLDVLSFLLSLFTASLAEWIMYIVDFIYLPINAGFWLYFRTKKINKSGLWLLSSIIEFLPIIDVLNFQTAWALLIIWTNMTKTGEKLARSVPAPKINPLPKTA